MLDGTVKWFNKTKGYGFICPNDGSDDVFIHVTTLEQIGIRYLDEDQAVSYETEIKDGRLRATAVSVANTNTNTNTDTNMRDNRRNNPS